MKIAITSSGNSLNSTIDAHFARCEWFAMIDDRSFSIDFIENSNRTMETEAGIAVVGYLHEKGVGKIISGEFGLKAKAELDKHSIQLVVITDHEKTIREIVDLLKGNE